MALTYRGTTIVEAAEVGYGGASYRSDGTDNAPADEVGVSLEDWVVHASVLAQDQCGNVDQRIVSVLT
jgi:hypothetical protein